ncbi:MAG: hypothetical protein V4808_07045 [Pseudomonadota bacterium]
MTPNQINALDYIRSTITKGGFSPTLAEIGGRIGVSAPGALRIVRALADGGHIRRLPGKARGIELPDADLRHIDTEALKAELARRGVIGGAFSRPERRAVHGRAVTCAADCCTIEVRFGHAFCLDHYRAISLGTRQELHAANLAARTTRSAEDASRYQDAFGQACDEANRGGRR